MTAAVKAGAMYHVLRHGTPAQREELVGALPPSAMTEMALPFIASDRPGMIVVALGPATIGYCNGGAPAVGAELARALHQYAVELYEGTPDHGLIPTTLSSLAHCAVQASNLLGRSADAVAFADEWIPFYKKLGEMDNLPALLLGRAEALLNLNRIDEATAALEDPAIDGNPGTDIGVARLRDKIAKSRTSITEDGRTLGAAPPATATDFAKRAELLKHGEAFLTRGATDESELTVRRRIREAAGLFVREKQPSADAIRSALATLEEGLAWARTNSHRELANDALYGVYLCRSRLHDPSAAADALLALRHNLEAARSSITNVAQRGGAFLQYPHLFAVLSEKLHAAGRFAEMLEAIEASKGRGVADLLTQRGGGAVADSTIYSEVARLPVRCREGRFQYVTYFVDDEVTYAVFVASDGTIHAPAPTPITRSAIRAAASPMVPESAAMLAPLVAWIETFIEDGTIVAGSHLCIAADDDLANVPFALLPVRDRPLAEWVSTSRIHNAHHLAHVLRTQPVRPPEYLGLVVPSRQNVEDANWKSMRASLLAPIEYLAGTMAGETLRGEAVSPAGLGERKLGGRVVHFSTHGMFRPDGKPFDESGLLLADGTALPDGAEVELATVLTPRKLLDASLDFTGSHVSMMACVSGLSREGAGGDALGMEWAMIQAGASSVLSTHWNVSAKLAGVFVTTFYKEWLGAGRTRAEALTATMASLRSSDGRAGEPASWAAFSLTGDWR